MSLKLLSAPWYWKRSEGSGVLRNITKGGNCLIKFFFFRSGVITLIKGRAGGWKKKKLNEKSMQQWLDLIIYREREPEDHENF